MLKFMFDYIIVDFFKNIPGFLRPDSALEIAVIAVFVLCAVLQVIVIRKGKPDWLLPLSFLAGEICCEVFFKTTDSGDAKIFSVIGFLFTAGFLACEIISFARKLWKKIRKA